MEETTEAPISFLRRVRSAWRATRLWFIFLMGVVGSIVAITIPAAQAEATFGLEVGDVAPQDIRAPSDLEAYVSEVLTQQARQAAADSVQDIYDPPDAQVARQQIESLSASLDYIDDVRADIASPLDRRLADLARFSNLQLDTEVARDILNLSSSTWETIKLETTLVLQQVMRSEIREGSSEEVRRTIPALVSISLSQDHAELVSGLASAFVAPNAMQNEEATQTARELAVSSVEPIQASFTIGETIVSGGEKLTAYDIEALNEFGLLTPPNIWVDVAVRSLLVVLLGSTITLYAYRVHGDQIKKTPIAATLSILFILSTLGMQLMIPDRTLLPYVYPAATLPILVTVLFGPGMGVITALVTGAMAGFLAPRGLELGLYVMLSGTSAALLIGQAERLSSFIWAGLAAAAGAALVVVIFRIPDPATDLWGKLSLLGAGIVSGLLSASLGFGFLLLIGNILGITTSLQLIELSRPDHPLQQLILQNAPGTYQHSLQVANLVDQGARAIGANALLARVGALYHDVGKAVRPQFFIENQIPGQNVHEQLDPSTSAEIILSHVDEGLELAQKYRLPPNIRAFISEHHGTMHASYQYQAALDAAGGDSNQVDRNNFIYPGPAPRSRETALLMLADGVEAKARADTPQNEKEIDTLVRWVIDSRLKDGQLSRTDLTFRDLDTIRKSFGKTLKNIYHPRIRYPQASQETVKSNQTTSKTDTQVAEKS